VANYASLPNTGLNLSLPIYLLVGLTLLIVGLIMAGINKIRA
jgi:LPXTG-motif cell wall-anchored protein